MEKIKILKSVKESPLYQMVNPKSIAICGASNNVTAMGTIMLMSLQSLDFKGSIYPVHPRETQVRGLNAYKSVLDLPEVPDLVILIVPNRVVPHVMEECGRKGVKHAVIVSGGFKEVGGKGADMEKEIVDIAEKYGIRFLGPNCIGLTNPHHQLNTTFFEYEGAPGFIGIVSQSGSFVTQMFNYISKLGIGFSTGFSVGNEANVDIVDCLAYLGACPNTKVIALYIEGIKRGRAFVEIARSIVPHKPIVALYVGGSDAGRRAVFSHTGAMAGPDRLYDGIFRQSGIIRAHSITELFDFCWVLGSLPRPKSHNVVIQTHSGGPGAVAADSCNRAGLELPALSSETIEKLTPFIAHTASINNPVDFTFQKNPLDYLTEIPKVLLEEKNADILVIYLLMSPKLIERAFEHMGVTGEQAVEQKNKLFDTLSKSFVKLLEIYNKPIICFTFRGLSDEFIGKLIGRGIPVFPDHERAARAMAAMIEYTRMQKRSPSDS